jgi:hypothetical protein
MTMLDSSQPQVTVALPLYGSHHAVEMIPLVAEMWLKQHVPCEVVVACARDPAEIGLGQMTGRSLRVVPANASLTLGALRNLAAMEARAPLLYHGDADVAPRGCDFLSRALRLRGDGVLVKPWMYRCSNAVDFVHACTCTECGPDHACFLTSNSRGCLSAMPGERFGWEEAILWAYPPHAYGHVDEHPKKMRHVPFHWGGVLVERHLFDLVGGYCEDYIGWGAEDDDLFVKLLHRAKIVQAWQSDPRLRCVHSEHPRAEVTPAVEKNRALLVRRFKEGADAMIHRDCAARRGARVSPP